MNAERKNDDVILHLEYHGAFVLNDMLARWNQNETLDNTDLYEDDSERIVVTSLGAVFEPLIDEAFSPDYRSVLDGARAAVRA